MGPAGDEESLGVVIHAALSGRDSDAIADLPAHLDRVVHETDAP